MYEYSGRAPQPLTNSTCVMLALRERVAFPIEIHIPRLMLSGIVKDIDN
jgi:hypothetical protein